MRSKDRLAELQRAAAGAAGGEAMLAVLTPQAAGGEAVLAVLTPQAAVAGDTLHGAEIDQVLREAERARGHIAELCGHVQRVRRLHADPTFHTNQQLQQQLEAAVARGHAAGRQAHAALQALDARAQPAARRNDARSRIVRLQYACARRLYADALASLHAALDSLREDRLQLLHDQIKLTNLTISDEECENLLDSNNISLFVDNLHAESRSARRALRDVEARHAELAALEGALRDVRDLFVQLAFLVAAQGERVDRVEYYALQASDHVETGHQELLKGTVSRNKARKKKMSLVICLCAGFLVVVMVLVFT